MSTTTVRLDTMAEALDSAGHETVATVLDTVSHELTERTAAKFPAFRTPEEPEALLANSAGQLLDVTRQYGARSYRVDGKSVQLVLDRGDVETTASLEFCSRDDAGKPQLRMVFECGGERMVRWASLAQFDAETLATATQHVFGTGENYGANVVTAAVRRPKLAEALHVCRAVNQVIEALAFRAAGRLLEAKVSGEPYQRALDRIRKLEERGVDVEKHTLLRLNRTNNIDKIEGLWQAAMHVGLGRVASEAKKKFRQITGKNPIKW